MSKYLELFKDKFPSDIDVKTKLENKPYIGYSLIDGIAYTVVPKPQPDNEIWYMTEDGSIVTPYEIDVFGANIVSNTYENGKGVIKFDNSVTSIGNYAFPDCSNLTSVTIPNSVTKIGGYAFDSCSSLTSVNIPNSVISIGDWTFRDCSSLTSINIPDNVISIGKDAFKGCSSLPVENNLRYADTYLVEAVDKTLSTYSIKEETKYINQYVFKGCSALTSITIPSSVIYIGGGAFESCTSLTSVTIPNSITTVSGGIFFGCSSLESVILHDNIISMPDSKSSSRPVSYYGFFQNCSSLTSITFNGVINKWNAIEKGQNWNSGCPEITVHCTDGDITIPANN